MSCRFSGRSSIPRSRRGPRSRLAFALAVLVGSGSALPTVAQAPPGAADRGAPLQGTVLDQATGTPIEAAPVLLMGHGLVAVTDAEGAFAFAEAPLGEVSVRVDVPGRPSLVEAVEVSAGDPAFIEIVVPSIDAVLSEILVRSSPRSVSAGASRTAADLLATEIPSMWQTDRGVGWNDNSIYLRGVTTFGDAKPLVVIDGLQVGEMDRALEILREIPAADVRNIDVLRGPAAAARFPYAADGVVLVETSSTTASGDSR